jgi:hypothetical protein
MAALTAAAGLTEESNKVLPQRLRHATEVSISLTTSVRDLLIVLHPTGYRQFVRTDICRLCVYKRLRHYTMRLS